MKFPNIQKSLKKISYKLTSAGLISMAEASKNVELTKQEIDILREYVGDIGGNYFSSINRALNYDMPGDLFDDDREFIKKLSAILNKLPNYTKTVYRGVGFPTLKWDKKQIDSFNSLKEGESLTFKGFSSASKSKKIAIEFAVGGGQNKRNLARFLFIIKSKKGKDITEYSKGAKNGKEVVFDKGTKFKVTKAPLTNKNVIEIYLEEI